MERRSADLYGCDDRWLPEHVYDHWTAESGREEPDDILVPAARGFYRRHHYLRTWPPDATHRGLADGRDGLGATQQRGCQLDTLSAGQQLVYGRQHSRQALRVHALRRRRAELRGQVQRGCRQGLRRL